MEGESSISANKEDEIHLNAGTDKATDGVFDVKLSSADDGHYVYTSPHGSRYWIPNVTTELIPYVGKSFDTMQDAEQFYEKYGFASGFSTHKSTMKRNPNGVVTIRMMECSRSGKRSNVKVDTSDDACKKQHRPSIRIGCDAGIRFCLSANNIWEIYRFEDKHNHSLVPERDAYLMTFGRKLNFTHQSLIHNASRVNMGPVKAHNLAKEMYGGFEKVGASKVDFKNYRRDLNYFIGESDAQMVINNLKSKETNLPNYSFHYATDDEGNLRYMFWADETAKLNYNVFGDIVSFDATFNTNKYKMVFVPFTGINNHKKCVTFGSGLLCNESIDAYTWLLNAFVLTHIKQPTMVVTDQDPAMKEAVMRKFLKSTHRLCMCHIMENVTSKVGHAICSAETGFLKRIQRIVWDEKIKPVQFEILWDNMILDFGLDGHKWLSDMYNIRSRWIPAFFHDVPLSGLMKTTSRSEGMNNFFGQFTNGKSTLVEFFNSYESALDAQRNMQRTLDYESRNKTPDIKTNMKIEKNLADIVTHKLFSEFQEEIVSSIYHCICTTLVETETSKVYTIRDCDNDKVRTDEHEVSMGVGDMDLKCTCRYFERMGIVCRHIFFVLRLSKIDKLPE